MSGFTYLKWNTYIILCNTKSRAALEALRNDMNDMLDTIQSFHDMNVVKHRSANLLVIKLITARSGDTHANLAHHSALGKTVANYLRPINGSCSQSKQPGQYVKIVE